MSKFENIKEYLLNSFDKLNDVLEIELRDEFSIIDHKGQAFIIGNINPENNTFTIWQNGKCITENDFDDTKVFNIKNAKVVGFIPIDGKSGLVRILKVDEESHCDFVLFDENDFCFVELKLNATSLGERAIRENRQKAIKQLKNTIALFDQKLDKNYGNLELEAYVCTPETYPKANASWQELALDFLEEVGVRIFEQNEKTCR
jgi:hypothetical protein